MIHAKSDVESVLKAHAISSEEQAEIFQLGSYFINKERGLSKLALEKGDYLRVHLKPKRYPVAQIDFSHIVGESKDFIIVNKPPGIPVHNTLDNAVENLVNAVSQLCNQVLFVTHRIDIPTQGLVVLGKNQEAVAQFHQRLRTKKVLKRYRALVAHPVPLGLHRAYMKPSDFGKKTLYLEEKPGYLNCELVVESCVPEGNYFQVEMTLLTGRTHQIRAQLAFLGSPILGDFLYGDEQSYPYLALQAFHVSFTDANKNQVQVTLPPEQAPWRK